MKKLLNDFFDRYFHDEESLILLILLAVGLFLLVLIGEMLAPLIAAIVIAYLMQGLVNLLLHQVSDHNSSMGSTEAAGERDTKVSARLAVHINVAAR